MKEKKSDAISKPDYVQDLEKSYGPPNQEGFGGAVFFEVVKLDDDLEDLAQKYYQYFLGDLWERWGEDAWMGPWKEVYVRDSDAKHEIVKELQGIEDPDAQRSVPLIQEVAENAEAAREVLSTAYDAPEVNELRVYNTGDGEAMSGLLIAGRRDNGEAAFLVVLMD
ncbi:MAG: hypothetical protein ACK2T4_02990 [Candidatus Promineifilaceae bacterium]|jgi:hypothetical protein